MSETNFSEAKMNTVNFSEAKTEGFAKINAVNFSEAEISKTDFCATETAASPSATTENWCVYLILCADRSLYCGISNRPARRFADHAAGKGAKYTRLRKPVSMRLIAQNLSKSEALKQECAVKQLSAERKRSLWADLPEFKAV